MTASEAGLRSGARDYGFWVRLIMPSLADVIFLAVLFNLVFAVPQLLDDPDIGWHIRNGEHILANHVLPRTDYFSYTMTGRPWYSWEWLYDALIASVHSVAHLNGVVLFSAIIVALTFALLLRQALKSGGNIVIALGLTVLAGMASSIHLLARPHLLTWLLTLVCFQLLDSFERGECRNLFVLPALMLFWVNVHGGFLAGLALLGLCLSADLWTAISTTSIELREQAGKRARHLSLIFLLSLAATLITPYGYRLHIHVFGYLTNRFLMDRISEFLSPDFHLLQIKAFAVLLILTFVALALSPRKATARDLLLIGFSTWVGLYAARNLPIATIVLTLTIAPMLGEAMGQITENGDAAAWLRRMGKRINGFSGRIGSLEEQFNRHLVAGLVTAAIIFVACGQRANSLKTMHFDDKRVPVHAAEYMAAHNIRDHFYSIDSWGGYFVYRLYPNVHVMLDDRHDFYGEAFLRNCLEVWHVGHGWSQILNTYRVNWVVVPADSALSNTLKIANGWRVVYDDHTAIIFERVIPLQSE